MSNPVPLEQRVSDVEIAADDLAWAAASWLEKRAAGRVSPDVDADLTAASQKLTAAQRRLKRTEKRSS